jgi:hypothetical protein
VLYVPAPGHEGSYAFLFKANDGGAPPDGGDSNIATVTVSQDGPQVLHDFNLDADPGWPSQGDWAFGEPTGGGSHGGDPTSGASGPNVYGYNLDGDYADGMGAEYLTTPKFDLTEVTQTRIEFQRWLGVESSTFDRAALEITTDEVVWQTVWENGTATIDESSWSLQSYDISAIADGEPKIRLRWVMGPTSPSTTYPGWNLDDIRIWGVGPSQGCAAAPGEVPDLRMWADKQTLDWMPPDELGGTVAPFYDVLRSGSADDFTAAGSCIESDDGEDTVAVDLDLPAPGSVFYYLVRAENGCGAGSLGEGADGSPRSGIACPSAR